MTQQQIGELAALVTAVLWTLSALAWTSAGRHVGALAVSFLRLMLAVGMLMVYGYFRRGLPWPSDADPRVWQVLGVSGFLGFFVSDLCLFKAFLIIGPRLSLLLVTSLTPPLVVLISWAWRGGGIRPAGMAGDGHHAGRRAVGGVGTARRRRASAFPQAVALRALSGRRGHREPVGRHGAGEGRHRRLRPGSIGTDPNPGCNDRLFPLDHPAGALAADSRGQPAAQADAHSLRRRRGRAVCRRVDVHAGLAELSRGHRRPPSWRRSP